VTTKNTTSDWYMAKLPFLWVQGARPPVPRTVIVRDRDTGKLVEVPLAPCEAPLLDEGDEGTTYVFSKGEKVPADHPAVTHKPQNFNALPAPVVSLGEV
jgi:hypothetical protein